MVVDTSVLLCVLFDEPAASWALDRLDEHAAALRMSTVNLAETLILLRDRQPQRFEELEELILTSGIRFVAPTVEQARTAAAARLRFPLNLGDCFAYALAVEEGVGILTLDAAFARADVPVALPEG
jgi:ribonuclease VapC